jgi:UDP-GlcNAc:undecaprenyl-phosphate GlcNAc-1-phosphate transferase
MLGILTAAILMSATGTLLIVRKKGAFGLDHPDLRRKSHDTPIPRLGGLPIFLTLLAGFAMASWRFENFTHQWWPIVLANCLMFGVGFFDDVKPMGARVKLLGQFGCACILYACDISIDEITSPFGNTHFSLGWWSFPITILWLVAIPNIINLIDGMDGLATGFGLCMCLVLAFVGHFNLYGDVVLVAVIMSGALTGFLFFNLPPARIFLGDGGAYLIGFFIASVSLKSSNKGSVLGALLVMIVALGVPILDTFFAITRRALRGVPIFRADAEHIHHRLMTLGFSKTKALIALYSVCLALGLVGILVLVSKGRALPVVISVLFLLALMAARYLGYVKSWSDVRNQLRGALVARQEMLYVASWGRIVEWEADKLKSPEEFIVLLEQAVGKAGLHVKPQKGWIALPLLIAGGRVCNLYYDGKPEDQQRWLARADFFTSGINRALERWPDLSCVMTQETTDQRQGSALPA